jgi:hypothetical protein
MEKCKAEGNPQALPGHPRFVGTFLHALTPTSYLDGLWVFSFLAVPDARIVGVPDFTDLIEEMRSPKTADEEPNNRLFQYLEGLSKAWTQDISYADNTTQERKLTELVEA